METVGAFDAKNHFGELLDRVERGESVTITRQGKPIAQLVPTTSAQLRDRAQVIHDFLNFAKGRKLEGMKIRDMIEEGRRF